MKSEKLKELRGQIIDKIFKESWREVWFYPTYKQVSGFLGYQDIFFVGLNPSSGYFPSKYDEFFYEQLLNNNFEKAHITDLLKIKTTNENILKYIENEQVLNEQIEFIAKEIEILDPKIIVTLGKKCDDIFRNKFHDKNLKIIKIRHYSSIRFPKNKKLFSDELREVKANYIEICRVIGFNNY